MSDVGARPVEVFLDGIARADLGLIHDRLAEGAVLTVPSLRATLTGRAHVVAAVHAVLVAFPDLRYTSRSRYIAPGQVTDEVVLTGIRLGPWGDVPPSGRPHQLPARLVIEHDGLLVTSIGIWADRASLQALVDDSVDLSRSAGQPIVDALRAMVPAGDPRVILGTGREARAAAPVTPAPPVRADELNPAAAKAAALKVPMPRRVRRLLVVTSAGAMAAAAALIVAWVARGALSAPSAPTVQVSPVSTAAGAPSPVPSKPAPTKTSGRGYTRVGDLITLSTDLTFEVNSARLNGRAKKVLDDVIAQVRAEKRTGKVVVNGFTDWTGTEQHNMELSQSRADAVAAYLEKGLRGRGIQVTSNGLGEKNPKGDNRTEAGKATNRRVEITVPGRPGTPSPVSS
ncbi:OmpA family protein [Kineosporia sp. A_224]|uniref:OmpA family protein n=1 Tax=Kineosporia sp. A_224 TaxID=1962180 RepID=UPI000B4B6A84|nr:OmpA family protein [Kineosporia sp. A_224]